jgi:hypothetical protein
MAAGNAILFPPDAETEESAYWIFMATSVVGGNSHSDRIRHNHRTT